MGRGVNSRSNLADSNEGTSLETGPNVNRKKNQAELHARQILFEILEQDTVTESRTTHTRTRTHTHTHTTVHLVIWMTMDLLYLILITGVMSLIYV